MTEVALGDYFNLKENPQKLKENTRRHMITLIESLIAEKNYKEDTLYLAVSLADRYLVNLCLNQKPSPCMILLAISATLLAAKLE